MAKASLSRARKRGQAASSPPPPAAAGPGLSMDVFLALGAKLCAARTPVEAARAIFAAADRLWRWDVGTLDLYDRETDRIRPIMNFDIVDGRRREVPTNRPNRAPTPRIRRILRHGPELILRRRTRRQQTDSAMLGDINRLSASIMCAPLRGENQPVGVLSIQSYTPRAYTPADLRLLQVLADYCGGALERIRAENAQRLIEAEFRLVFEQNVDAIFWADAETGLILNCNRKAEELTERSRAELIGLHQTRLHPPDRDYARVFRRHASAAFASAEAEVLTASGRRIPVWISATVVQLGERRIVQGVFHDITEQRRAEQALREAYEKLEQRVAARTAELQAANAALRRSEERTLALLDHSPAAIALADSEGRLVYINRAFVRWFGYERHEIPTVAEWYRKAYPDAKYRNALVPAWEKAMRRAREFHEPIPPMEVRVRCRDGTDKLTMAVTALVHGQAMVIFYDITARKHAEEQLKQLSQALLASQDLERRRIARELHDSVAQLLVGQMLSLKQLQNRLPADDTALRPLVTDALQIGKDCLREVRTMSFLLHPPHLQELGLAGAVQYYAQEFGARSGIRVQVQLPPRLCRLPEEHELALYRVLQEALANILRHSGSPIAEVRLTCNAKEARLEVCDAGKGMPDVNSLQTQNTAYGIGIPGMRERLQHLGGRLEILPANPGTRVVAILPRGKPKRNPLTAGAGRSI